MDKEEWDRQEQEASSRRQRQNNDDIDNMALLAMLKIAHDIGKSDPDTKPKQRPGVTGYSPSGYVDVCGGLGMVIGCVAGFYAPNYRDAVIYAPMVGLLGGCAFGYLVNPANGYLSGISSGVSSISASTIKSVAAIASISLIGYGVYCGVVEGVISMQNSSRIGPYQQSVKALVPEYKAAADNLSKVQAEVVVAALRQAKSNRAQFLARNPDLAHVDFDYWSKRDTRKPYEANRYKEWSEYLTNGLFIDNAEALKSSPIAEPCILNSLPNSGGEFMAQTLQSFLMDAGNYRSVKFKNDRNLKLFQTPEHSAAYARVVVLLSEYDRQRYTEADARLINAIKQIDALTIKALSENGSKPTSSLDEPQRASFAASAAPIPSPFCAKTSTLG